ncbi:MAG: DUF433 domain-containing protein [Acidobacteria bacterium]|nr:DUF433 domain-containing protein [Acidobacteriota bacterium]
MKQYVENIDGEYVVTGSRVLLDSIVYGFQQGKSPESILQSFPTLTLAQVYGALTFYLDHQAEVETYLAEREKKYEVSYQTARAQDSVFYQRLEAICRKSELAHQ